MGMIRGYLGTYASPESLGIYTFTLDGDSGALSWPELCLRAPDCKYLSLQEGVLAAPVQRADGAGLCVVHTEERECAACGTGMRTGPPETIRSEELLTEQTTSCHVVQDGECIYTANYHEGTVLIYKREQGGSLVLSGRIENGREAGCHQVLIHGNCLLVPCLLLDRVKFYDRRRGYAPAGELVFPQGTGPRHGIFDREQERFFLVSELSNQVFSYEIADCKPSGKTVSGPARFRPAGIYDIFPAPDGLKGREGQGAGLWAEGRTKTAPPASAAIRFSPDEKYLYVSTRFADCITVFRVEGTSLHLVQQTGSGGEGPRDIALTQDGNFLLAANRTGGGLVSFRRNGADGTIGPVCGRVPAPEAVSLVLEA